LTQTGRDHREVAAGRWDRKISHHGTGVLLVAKTLRLHRDSAIQRTEASSKKERTGYEETLILRQNLIPIVQSVKSLVQLSFIQVHQFFTLFACTQLAYPGGGMKA
jgi:hypothetical protein